MKRLLPLLLLLLGGSTEAFGGPITAIVAFGDSLSDQGNAFALTGGLFPPPAERTSP